MGDPSPARVPAGLPCAPEAVDDFLSRPPRRVIELMSCTRGPFLVLGAGGKIGLHLSVMLRRALAEGGRTDRVMAVSRFGTLRDRTAFEHRGVETFPCDLAHPAGEVAHGEHLRPGHIDGNRGRAGEFEGLEAGGETWHKPTGFERRDGRY